MYIVLNGLLFRKFLTEEPMLNDVFLLIFFVIACFCLSTILRFHKFPSLVSRADSIDFYFNTPTHTHTHICVNPNIWHMQPKRSKLPLNIQMTIPHDSKVVFQGCNNGLFFLFHS